MNLQNIERRINNRLVTEQELKWLVEKLKEIRELINDERITKSETVNKISKIVND